MDRKHQRRPNEPIRQEGRAGSGAARPTGRQIRADEPAGNAMAHAMQRISGNVLVRGVPGGMGGPRAGRACASSAPPRARAARRSQNPSPAPRRRSSFRLAFVGDGGGEGGALCVNGGPMRGRSGRILYRRRPLAHANRPRRVYAMRCDALSPRPRVRWSRTQASSRRYGIGSVPLGLGRPGFPYYGKQS